MRLAGLARIFIAASALVACNGDRDSLLAERTPAPSSSGTSGGAKPGADAGEPTPPPGASDAGAPPIVGHDAGAPPPALDASTPPAQDASTPPADGFDAFQHHNLDVINKYRAGKSLAPLVLDAQLCAFALAGTQELSRDHQPHHHFISASNDGSLWNAGFHNSAAENQGDPNGWYVMSQDATQNELLQIDDIQKAMFAEGPGGGHYDNIMSTKSRRVGVGLLEVNGELYLTNDFSE